MTTLRQRLLLVAGWIIAAVGAGLVASGAVAVAGGQVLDRPLRPMTAAEVAALPVVEVEAPDALEPHASGGLGSTTGDSTSGSVDADGSEEPSGAGGSTATPSDDIVVGDDPDEPVDPVLLTETSAVRVVAVEGGQVSFAESDGSLLLLWATPSAGYVATTREQRPDRVLIAFSSSLTVSVVEADLIDGRIVVSTRPEPLT